jgi:glycosyltransferase involved in cell wall biosynthesis
MMQNLNIVCFANDWKSDPTSKHHVMSILSKQNKILWVDSISMRRPSFNKSDISRIATKIKTAFAGLTEINSNLFHFSPIILPFPAITPVRIINKYILMLYVKFYARKLGMRDVHLWTFLPNITELLGHLNETFTVYYCVDEWSKFSFIHGESMRAMEVDLLKKVDLVITTAEHLYRDKCVFNSHTHLIKHGVDYDYFSRALLEELPKPNEFTGIKEPIIGFFGLIHEWIDLQLLEEIASMRPDWSIILIGKASVDISHLLTCKNVHWLGPKPYKALINYCKYFDVGLIPFVVNDLTASVNPIKLREYLAAGIPVVSTPLPEVVGYCEDVFVCSTAEEFIQRIEYILRYEDQKRKTMRSERMANETWENKVESICSLINMYVEQKKKK